MHALFGSLTMATAAVLQLTLLVWNPAARHRTTAIVFVGSPLRHTGFGAGLLDASHTDPVQAPLAGHRRGSPGRVWRTAGRPGRSSLSHQWKVAHAGRVDAHAVCYLPGMPCSHACVRWMQRLPRSLGTRFNDYTHIAVNLPPGGLTSITVQSTVPYTGVADAR